ncbi:MAG: hypothetical protein ABSF71_01175 [Terriglobia bacterium]
MRTIKQLVSFVLGVAVGLCVHSVLKLRPLSPTLLSNISTPARANNPRAVLSPPWVQRSMTTQVPAPVRVHSEKAIRAVLPEIPQLRALVEPAPPIVSLAERAAPADAMEVAAASISTASPPPTVFKTIGYVEKAGGQVEAIILQENQVQVVHLGDLVAGRYRVTKVSPDSVEASDEMQVEFPMTEPGVAKSDILTASVAPQPSTPPVLVLRARPEVLAASGSSEHLLSIHNADLTSPLPTNVAEFQPAAGSDFSREGRSTLGQTADPAADSLGFVQKANGKIESVVADGDTVRLLPQTPTVAVAQAAPPAHSRGGAKMPASRQPSLNLASDPSGVIERANYTAPSLEAASGPALSLVTQTLGDWKDRVAKLLVMFKPLGYIEHSDGELDAILSQDDEVYVVRQGDRFAGHYRAVSVSADAVEAVEEPIRPMAPFRTLEPPSFPGLLSASARPGLSRISNLDCLACKSSEVGEVSPDLHDDPPVEGASGMPGRGTGILPVEGHRQDGHGTTQGAGLPPVESHGQDGHAASDSHATFIFQSLGYVETQDGDFQAVVADGSEVYLVRQGETFAGQYRATSVDPVLVLAVKAPAEQKTGNFLSAETESSDKLASKNLSLHFPLFAWASMQTSHEVGASDSLFGTDLGVNLLNSSLNGFDFIGR